MLTITRSSSTRWLEAGGDEVPDDVVRLWVDPSVTSIPARAFFGRKKLNEVELCEGLVEIGNYSFSWCNLSTFSPHSGGFVMMPSQVLFDVPFVSTMALKAFEVTHSMAASSPTLESHPSSLRFPIICYEGVQPYFLSSCPKSYRKLDMKHSAILVIAYEMWPFLPTLCLAYLWWTQYSRTE